MVAKVQVYGLGETLKELYYLDRTLYNGIRKQIKAPADELVRQARTQFPTKPPVSYWHTTPERKGESRFPYWDGGKVRSRVTAVFGGRANRMTGEVPILRLRQKDAGGVVLDMAGSRKPSIPLVKGLETAGFEKPSRIMWRTVNNGLEAVLGSIKASLKSTEEMVSKRLAGGTISQRQLQSERASLQARRSSGQFGSERETES
jgi:hypothetical protein